MDVIHPTPMASSTSMLEEIEMVVELAGQNDGVVTRKGLIPLIGEDGVERFRKRGLLHPQHHGVYAFGHAALSERGILRAALAAAGDKAILSHRSAAAYWGLTRWDGYAEVTTTARTGHPLPGLIVHRARRVPEHTTHNGLRVTTPERTLLDLTAVLTSHAVSRILGEAEYHRLLNRDRLRELAKGRKGAKAIREALGDTPRPTREDLEPKFLKLIRDAALPAPETNQGLHGFKPDFLWRAQRVIVETDGWAAHGRRDAFERDRARDTELQARGYRTVRVTARQLQNQPLAVLVRIGALLYSADSSHQ